MFNCLHTNRKFAVVCGAIEYAPGHQDPSRDARTCDAEVAGAGGDALGVLRLDAVGALVLLGGVLYREAQQPVALLAHTATDKRTVVENGASVQELELELFERNPHPHLEWDASESAAPTAKRSLGSGQKEALKTRQKVL